VIDLRLAMRLKAAGLDWQPAPGDRFAVPQPELLGQVFTLSDMTIEVYQRPTGTVLGFNGTTEWALDSVQAADAVWLPAEHQLRSLLGRAFRGLQVLAEDSGGDETAGGGEAAGGDEADLADPSGTPPPGADGAVDHGNPDAVPDTGAYEVFVEVPGRGPMRFRAPVAEDAYALALLVVLESAGF
jgi:hypothetical protein